MNIIGGPTLARMDQNADIAADMATMRPYQMRTYPLKTAPCREWFYKIAQREGFSVRYYEYQDQVHILRAPDEKTIEKKPHFRETSERYYSNRDKFLAYVAEKVNPARAEEGLETASPGVAGHLYDVIMAERHLEDEKS